MNSLLLNLQTARRRAAFAAIVLTTALALGTNTAVFSVLQAFLFANLAVPDTDRVMVVPDFTEAKLDVRVTRASERAPLLARLRELAAPINARDGFRLELTGSFNRPPKEGGLVEEAAFAAWQQGARALGVAPFT